MKRTKERRLFKRHKHLLWSLCSVPLKWRSISGHVLCCFKADIQSSFLWNYFAYWSSEAALVDASALEAFRFTSISISQMWLALPFPSQLLTNWFVFALLMEKAAHFAPWQKKEKKKEEDFYCEENTLRWVFEYRIVFSLGWLELIPALIGWESTPRQVTCSSQNTAGLEWSRIIC